MVSCTKSKGPAIEGLRIHLPAVTMNLDPQKMEDAYSMAVATQLYRGLLRYNTTGDIRADLAESWTESEDHKTYRFKIRKATFSDGKPITAKNVQMTFARMFLVGASMAADIDYISGARAFKSQQDIAKFGVVPIDDHTVEFRLSEPSAIFLKQLAVADCSILPIEDFKQNPEISAKGSFSGPYKLVGEVTKTNLTIEKWRADALDSPLPPKSISYSMIAEKPVELALAEKIDTLDHYRIDEGEKSQLQKLGWAAAATELAGEVFVVLNPDKIPSDVRRALYSSVDSAEIIRSLGNQSYRAAFGLIPFGLAGELTASDVEGLKALRSEKILKPIVIEMDYEGASNLEEKTAHFLKEKWALLGVTVKLNPLSKGEKLQRLFGKKSQAIIARKAMDYPDGFSVLGYFKGKYESNYFYVDDKAVDTALLNVIQIVDSEDRANAYKDIQKKILAHNTVIPLFFGSEASGLWSRRVKSVPSHPLGIHTLPLESVEMSVE